MLLGQRRYYGKFPFSDLFLKAANDFAYVTIIHTCARAAVLIVPLFIGKHIKIQRSNILNIEISLQAIRDGAIDATVAQNPPGHGYITCFLLKYLLDGWTPVKDYQYIDAGIVIVTKDNLGSYAAEVRRITDRIAADLTTKYLRRPN